MRSTLRVATVFSSVGCVMLAAFAHGASIYEVGWSTIDGGGAMFTTGGDFELSGTIGQLDAGVVLTSGSLELTGGFWPAARAGESGPPYIVQHDGLQGQTRPRSGYIDPRSENLLPPCPCEPTLGVDRLAIVFNEPVFGQDDGGPVDVDDFLVTCTGNAVPPVVTGVDAAANPVITVTLEPSVCIDEWTTVQALVQNASGLMITNHGNQGPGANEPDRVDVGFLPGDIDQDGFVQPIDLLRFRQYIQQELSGGVCSGCPHHTIGGLAEDYFDTDRSGVIDPVDLLRYRQLLLGTGAATRAWSGERINPRP